VKCHSKMFDSIGAAWKSGEGFMESSEASLTAECGLVWGVRGVRLGMARTDAFDCGVFGVELADCGHFGRMLC
jgi:hypothetical protein